MEGKELNLTFIRKRGCARKLLRKEGDMSCAV